ncbi:hypothetical protein IB286_09490 [Spongiibacter sp. KMU-158]|uniref:Uncharacterized protein n=1 Tax=Spongiibacter pelagi TaxID=2760804 RepID=A0A927C1Y2_9GAMM|nr:hypothetical protein [Spongiibacter pelagi]MBD2859239.1 hypothetical protein [Spongiibacter pelagi]
MNNDMEEWLASLRGERESDSRDPLDTALHEYLKERDQSAQATNELGFQRLLKRLEQEPDIPSFGPKPHSKPGTWAAGLGFAACLLLALSITLKSPVQFDSAESMMAPAALYDNAVAESQQAKSQAQIEQAKPMSMPAPDRSVQAKLYGAMKSAPAAERALVGSERLELEQQQERRQELNSAGLNEDVAASDAADETQHKRQSMASACRQNSGVAELEITGTNLEQVKTFYHFIGAQEAIHFRFDPAGFAEFTYQTYGAHLLELTLQSQFGLHCPLDNTHTLQLRFPIPAKMNAESAQ